MLFPRISLSLGFLPLLLILLFAGSCDNTVDQQVGAKHYLTLLEINGRHAEEKRINFGSAQLDAINSGSTHLGKIDDHNFLLGSRFNAWVIPKDHLELTEDRHFTQEKEGPVAPWFPVSHEYQPLTYNGIKVPGLYLQKSAVSVLDFQNGHPGKPHKILTLPSSWSKTNLYHSTRFIGVRAHDDYLTLHGDSRILQFISDSLDTHVSVNDWYRKFEVYEYDKIADRSRISFSFRPKLPTSTTARIYWDIFPGPVGNRFAVFLDEAQRAYIQDLQNGTTRQLEDQVIYQGTFYSRRYCFATTDSWFVYGTRDQIKGYNPYTDQLVTLHSSKYGFEELAMTYLESANRVYVNYLVHLPGEGNKADPYTRQLFIDLADQTMTPLYEKSSDYYAPISNFIQLDNSIYAIIDIQ